MDAENGSYLSPRSIEMAMKSAGYSNAEISAALAREEVGRLGDAMEDDVRSDAQGQIQKEKGEGKVVPEDEEGETEKVANDVGADGKETEGRELEEGEIDVSNVVEGGKEAAMVEEATQPIEGGKESTIATQPTAMATEAGMNDADDPEEGKKVDSARVTEPDPSQERSGKNQHLIRN